ncbi:MAG: ribosome biogenesis GTPase Der [Patescibacteria group bacterium]|nr:ribosome biogenesis GTPase Der [Patescibacteria group bacterium]
MNLPLVAIIGRVNVGKSTLFNRLTEQRKALVSTVPGTTRDLNFGVCSWQKKKFRVVDTGGIFETKINKKLTTANKQLKKEDLSYQIESRARKIIDQADLLLFVVDARDGILSKDRLIAQLIKKIKKPCLLVANKTDNQELFSKAQEFRQLGIGEVHQIAAVSGKGVGDMADRVLKLLTPFRGGRKQTLPKGSKNSTTLPKGSLKSLNVSIIGKPNVGKSSLLNKILGEDRVIVSPIPHTTREPQDTFLEFEGQPIKLIDTAGIRRKSKVYAESLEAAGINMSIGTLKRSDIALFVLDTSENLASQDAQLANLIIESGVSVIIVANKYDQFKADKDTTKELTNYIHRVFPFMTWAPIIFTSAKSGHNCQKILSLVMAVKRAREQKIPAKELSGFFDYLKKKMPPPRQPKKAGSYKKARALIKKFIQKDVNPPVFAIIVGNEINVPEPYLRYLENSIRNRFKFIGTPLKIVVERTVKLA